MKQYAPAVKANQQPILEILQDILPNSHAVLEISSGTGQHAVHFARALPHLTWQPSDPDPIARESIRTWAAEAALPNLLPPLSLDVLSSDWSALQADALVNINMLHVAPWEAALALLGGAAVVLPQGGALFLYGPFFRRGHPAAPSNLAFDRSLRSQNPQWGLRAVEDVACTAAGAGLSLARLVEMPAHNLSLVLHKK